MTDALGSACSGPSVGGFERRRSGSRILTVWFSYCGGIIAVEFEFDPTKSVVNQEKHGIDFVRAQELWRDSVRVEVPARTTDEARWLVIGRIDGKHWSAVVTYREERIRIISVRRSRDEEVAIYEG
jgi:uncharacterized protein